MAWKNKKEVQWIWIKIFFFSLFSLYFHCHRDICCYIGILQVVFVWYQKVTSFIVRFFSITIPFSFPLFVLYLSVSLLLLSNTNKIQVIFSRILSSLLFLFSFKQMLSIEWKFHFYYFKISLWIYWILSIIWNIFLSQIQYQYFYTIFR